MARKRKNFELDFKNFITCKCGHDVKYHKSCGPPIGEEWCEGKGLPKDVGLRNVCNCFVYRPDNLSHIEEIAKKRGLI